MSILVLCTGNICRSPVAAAMLRRRLDELGEVAVTSAGFVTQDRESPDEILEVLESRGLDGRDHRSRRVQAVELAGHDLVLCMERSHVREIAVLDRSVFERTFTLPDLVRRALADEPRRDLEDVRLYLRRLGAGRRTEDLLGSAPEDDIVDPYRRSAATYRQVADQIESLIDQLIPRMFPS